MTLDQLTIEKMAVNYLEKEILCCPRLNPIIKADDKVISFDGEIQLFRDDRKRKDGWVGRCPIQVKGHVVGEDDFKKKKITYPVSIDDLKVYRQDGGVIYFVVYLLDNEDGFYSYKIFYNEFLPLDIDIIFLGVKEGQKTKNVEFISSPKNVKEKEAIIAQFIRDKKLQSGSSFDKPIKLDNLLSQGSSYVFWVPKDFSFVGNKRPTYLYEKSKEKRGTYFPVGKIFIESVVANNVPIKVRVEDKIYFDNAHIELKKGGVIKSIIFNPGLSLNIKSDTTGKIRLTKKCTVDEYLCNLEFLLALAKGGKILIEGVGEGGNFNFDFPVDSIREEISDMKKIQRILKRLHVKKHIQVKDLSRKNLVDLHFLYKAIVEETHIQSNKNIGSQFGTYNVGKLNFLLVIYVDKNHKLVYKDFFEVEDIRFVVGDGEGKKYPSSIYVTMKKKNFLQYDNIHYPSIIKSITGVEYSFFHGNLVNALVLEMLAAYDEAADNELLETAIELSNWLFSHEELPVYYINKMQSIKRKRPFTKEEENQIRDFRGQETDTLLLAGFSAILGNVDDYKYYLEKLNKEDKERILMFPIKNLIKVL